MALGLGVRDYRSGVRLVGSGGTPTAVDRAREQIRKAASWLQLLHAAAPPSSPAPELPRKPRALQQLPVRPQPPGHVPRAAEPVLQVTDQLVQPAPAAGGLLARRVVLQLADQVDGLGGGLLLNRLESVVGRLRVLSIGGWMIGSPITPTARPASQTRNNPGPPTDPAPHLQLDQQVVLSHRRPQGGLQALPPAAPGRLQLLE
jgi:hypothetical protein